MALKKWYLDGGYSYITVSWVGDCAWVQQERKSLSDSLNHLVQILALLIYGMKG